MRSRPPSPSHLAPERNGLFLDNGSRVAVIGGGPAGSFFTYFLFEMAERIGMELAVDIYEPRDFTKPAPHGCNMCGGILSESLVQLLATEGIDLPSTDSSFPVSSARSPGARGSRSSPARSGSGE